MPEAWQLTPGKWVKGFRKRSKLPSEDLKQMLMKINAPLLMAYLPPVDAFISVSTFQIDAKPIEYLTELGGFSGIFEHMLLNLEAMHPDLKILERHDEFIVAGSRGAYIKLAMTAYNKHGVGFYSMSEAYVFHSSRSLFVMGFSGPFSLQHRPVNDFESILRSIKLS